MNIDEVPMPQKGQKLFVYKGNYYDSYIGWGDLHVDFAAYMEGYIRTADDLVDRAIDSHDRGIANTYIYPICFLYRHYLELTMKYFYLNYSETDIKEKSDTIKKVNHNLNEIWKRIKPIFLKYITGEERDHINIVESYINQFQVFDESSYNFRYPITKDLDEVQKEERLISLDNLKKRMNELYNFFSGGLERLGVLIENRDELY